MKLIGAFPLFFVFAAAFGQCAGDLQPTVALSPTDLSVGSFLGWETPSSVGTADTVFAESKTSDGTRGVVWAFRKSGLGWVQSQRIVAPDAQTNDYFGVNFSASGDWLVVGGRVFRSGAAYLFKNEGGTWVHKQTLTGSGGFFGYRLATDGTRAIIGANGETSAATPVRIYLRSGDTWSLEQELPTPPGDISYLGNRVAISGDTAATITALAGVNRYNIYRRGAGGWQLLQVLTDPSFTTAGNLIVEPLRLLTHGQVNGHAEIRCYERPSSDAQFSTYRSIVSPNPQSQLAATMALKGDTLSVCEIVGNGQLGTFVFDLSTATPRVIARIVNPDGFSEGATTPAIHGSTVLINQRRAGGSWVIAGYEMEDCNSDSSWDLAQICSGQLVDSNQNEIPDICENFCHTAVWRNTGPQAFGPRWFHSQAYSGVNGATLLFGGTIDGSSTLGDTWLHTNSTWTRVATTGPAARNESAMCTTANGHILLFGGVAVPTNAFTAFADTWDWDGTTWTRINTTAAPTARLGHRMTFDSVRNRIVLFGGLDRNNALIGDTWEWDGSAWSQVATAGPSPRFEHVLAFDPIRNRTILFGGHNGSDLGDTWEWNGAVWMQIPTSGVAVKNNAAAAFDPGIGAVVMCGGVSNNIYSNDTLSWTGATWQPVQFASGFSPHYVHTMSYDPSGDRLIVAGGSSGTARTADTWELTSSLSMTTQPVSQSVLSGASASFSVQATGPISGFQWRKDGVAIVNGSRISGATTRVLNIANAQTSDQGTFDCVVSSDCRAIISSAAAFTVTYCPADFNHDSAVDLFDYLDFLMAFSSNQDSADFNHDHSIDFFDYLDLVQALASGC